MNNVWIGYLDRSYQQVKTALLVRLGVQAPEISDHSSSNLLVIIIEMFAGVVEHLNYYIDNMAREAFIATARRYDSMVKLVKLLDYRVIAAIPASTDLTLTFNTPSTFGYAIPINTRFSTGNGIVFRSIKNNWVKAGSTAIAISVKQWEPQTAVILGTTDGTANQAFLIPAGYCSGSMKIKVNMVVYQLVYTLGYSSPIDKHFIVEVDTDGNAYVVFGNGINGKIPTAGQPVKADYYTTLGDVGNVDVGLINTVLDTINVPGVTTITCSNNQAASAGFLYETIDHMRVTAPLSIRTLLRAVTFQDYIDVAKLCPGVGKAMVYYNCGKYVEIYIVPIGGGIASNALLDDVYNWFEDKRMITTFIRPHAAGETRLLINMEVTSRFMEDPAIVKSEIETALIGYGEYDNQEINNAVRISDLIALVDNLRGVNFLNLINLSSIPYANPVGHTTQLNWIRQTLATTTRDVWKLEYIDVLGVHYYRFFKNNYYIVDIPENTVYTDPDGIITFQCTGGVYTHGMQWTFVTYPINQDIVLDDFTIPIVMLGDLTINVTPTYVQPISL